jgi:hypothetical protein
MSTSCRLSLVFASEAPVAVVLRRGPTEWVELIRWDTSTDFFEHGQWLHGKIYGERCGLSPNGRLFVYFAMKYGRVRTEIFMAPLPPHHPKHPPGPLTIQSDLEYYSPDRQFRSDPSGYPEADWTGRDQGSRRIFTRAGALYALSPGGRERLLKDFNADVPRRLASPDWARVWTSERVEMTTSRAGRQARRRKVYR